MGLDTLSFSELNKVHERMFTAVERVDVLSREKQERDNMRCGNCKNYIGEDDGMCVREDLFELPTVKLSDYCSYFEKREV